LCENVRVVVNRIRAARARASVLANAQVDLHAVTAKCKHFNDEIDYFVLCLFFLIPVSHIVMSRYDASSDGSVGHRANAVTSEDDDDNDNEGGSSLAMFERESLPGPETPLPEGTRVRKL
jgi:hypothetical protein